MVLMNQHKMKHTESSLYTCGVCEFEATKLAMLKDHIEIKHTKQNMKIRTRITFVRNVKRSLRIYLSRDIICVHRKQSMLVPSSLEDLDIHKQVKHKLTKVNIYIQDQIVIKCENVITNAASISN